MSPAPTAPTTDDNAPAPVAATVVAPNDGPVVSDAPSLPVEETIDYVAKGPIFINGVRAYNENDPVTADAVKNNNLQKFVEKAKA